VESNKDMVCVGKGRVCDRDRYAMCKGRCVESNKDTVCVGKGRVCDRDTYVVR